MMSKLGVTKFYISFIFIFLVTLCNVLKYYIWFMKNFSNIFYESQIMFERFFRYFLCCVCVCMYSALLKEEHILIRKILSNQPSSKFLLASQLLQNRKINCWTFLIVTKLQGFGYFFATKCSSVFHCFFCVVCCCVYLNRTRYQW